MYLDEVKEIKLNKWSPNRRESLRRLFTGYYNISAQFSARRKKLPERDFTSGNYALHFLDKEEEGDPFATYNDTETEEDDDTIVHDGLTKGELRTIHGVNSVIQETASVGNRLVFRGKPAVLNAFENIPSLRIMQVTGVHSCKDFELLASILGKQRTIREVTLALSEHVLENGMPDGFDTALADGLSVEVLKFIVPWRYNRNAVGNNGRWLWQILHVLRNGCSRIVFEVGKDLVSVAMISSLFRFCMEVSANVDVEVWKSWGLERVRVIQIEKSSWNLNFVVRPVIHKLQLNWKALQVRGRGLQRALEGEKKEGDDTKFFSADDTRRHPWTLFSRNKLRVRQLSLGETQWEARKLSRILESVPPFENVFLEEFKQHFHRTPFLSYGDRLDVTCRANREFREEIRQVVEQLRRESRVLLFPSKRPAWLLPEISTAIMKMRIAGEGFAGRDAKMLLDIFLTDDERNGERVDAFVATCLLSRDETWRGTEANRSG